MTTTASVDKPAKNVAEAVDPARYVSSSAARSLEWRGIPAIPVYARWLRVDLSNHEALFQESGHHDVWSHVELSPVHGPVPMYQKFTRNVHGDFNPMALRGHDAGPMAIHVSVPPTNMLLPMHMLSSSCKWPVTARRRLHRGESLCAFAWVFAPYLYCNDKKEKKGEAEPESGSKASSSGKADSSSDAGGGPWPAAIGNGIGLCMVPTGGKTVWMRLSILDIILGSIDIAISKAIDWGFKQLCTLVPDSLAPGANATRHITPFSKQAARKAGNRDAARYMRDKMLNKATKAAMKGLLTDYQMTAPFKLASYSFVTQETKVWTYSDAGWSGQTVTDSARVTRVGLPPEPPGQHEQLEGDPAAKDSKKAEKDYWTDPSHPDEPAPAKLDYWTDPSQPNEPVERDYWTDPSQLDEPQEPLGPYEPGRTMLDELLEGAPHAW